MLRSSVTAVNAKPVTKPRRVLAVGDIALTVEMSLGAENVEVVASGGGHDAARRLRADRAFDLVVVSGVLADMSAYDFVASMLKHMPGLRAMIVGAGLSGEQTRALSSTGVVTFTPTIESALALMIPPATPETQRRRAAQSAPFEQSYSEVFDRIVDEARQGPAAAPTPVAPPMQRMGPSGDAAALLRERDALIAELGAARDELKRAADAHAAMQARIDAVEHAQRAKVEELAATAAAAEQLSQERDAWKRDSEARRQHVEGLSAQLQTLVEIRARLERDLADTQDLLAEAELARDNAVERTRVESHSVESATRDAEASATEAEAQQSAVSELRDRVGELQAALDAAHVRSAGLEESLRDERQTRTRIDTDLRLLRDERLALDERLRSLSTQADQALRIPELERSIAELKTAVSTRDKALAERDKALVDHAQALRALEARATDGDAAKRALDDEKARRTELEEQAARIEQQLREHAGARAAAESEREKAIAELEQAFKDIAALERERDDASSATREIESLQVALNDAERRATSVEKALLDERTQHKEARRSLEERVRERDSALEQSARERELRLAAEQKQKDLESATERLAEDASSKSAAEIESLRRAHADARAEADALKAHLALAEQRATNVDEKLQVVTRESEARRDAGLLMQKELELAERAARESATRIATLETQLAATAAAASTSEDLRLERDALRTEVERLRATRANDGAHARSDSVANDNAATVELLSGRVLSLQEEKLVLEKMCDDLRDMLRGANEELLKAVSAPVTTAPPATRATTAKPTHDPLAPVETRIAHEMPKVALAERAHFLESKGDEAPAEFDAASSEQAETTRVGVTLPDHLRDDAIDVDLFSMEERGDGGST
jgi:hypothetical protein